MFPHIRKFLKLHNNEKILFLQAFIYLGFMRAGILTRSFKQLTRTLDQQQHIISPEPLEPAELEKAFLIGKAINRAEKHTPWESTCLAQALTARLMLQNLSIPGVFYLGVCKEKDESTEMKAHAWSKCDKKIITGAKGHEAFTVVSTFRWSR